jgi:predicted methyltransferase
VATHHRPDHSYASLADPHIDWRAAVNAVSDVVQNRPRALREFDQIYMKTGDMVLQSEFVARWADDEKLAFIGDGDAIGICVALMQSRGIVDYGPTEIRVFDFDERICGAVKRFAEKEGLTNLSAGLYNCLDPFPGPTDFGCFYTNPPWGASNEGESVKVFAQRGLEATGYAGRGMIVIADDPELAWPRQVMAKVQAFVLESGCAVEQLLPRLHLYHLDDDPDLRSCNLMIAALADNPSRGDSAAITDPDRLNNFYGRARSPRARYVREKARLDYGKAHDSEYELELLEDASGQDH